MIANHIVVMRTNPPLIIVTDSHNEHFNKIIYVNNVVCCHSKLATDSGIQ